MTAARQRTDFLPETSRGVGVKRALSTVKLIGEFGNAVDHLTVLQLINHPIVVANTTGISFGGSKIYDFPAGAIRAVACAVEDLSFGLGSADNGILGTHGGDFSLGSTAPTDGSLTATDVDILPSTSIDPIVDGVANANSTAIGTFGTRAAAADAFFNIIIDDADVSDAASDTLLVNARILIHWRNLNLGDVI